MPQESTLGLDFLLESYIDNEVIPKSESMRDRFGSYWLHRQDLGEPAVVRFGRVLDYVPYANAYKVQADHQSTIWCTAVANTGLQPFGAKSINTLPPGVGVFYVWYRSSHWGYIIGVVPDFLADRHKGQSDYISPGSRAGVLVDIAHKNLLGMQFGGGVSNWSSGRPVDATGVGEWGATTETGLMFFLDPYMCLMKVDEETGVWGFFYDQLLRIAGHNLQIRSTLKEAYEVDDQDEASLISGKNPFTWERLGIWTWGNTEAHTAVSVLQTQNTNPELTRIEPKYEDQQAFMRKLDFEGYLGQGGDRRIILPPCPLPTDPSDLNRYSIDREFPCPFEEHIGLQGAYSLRSAKRVVIAKRWGVTPKQRKLPEDDLGDNQATYRASGQLGAGESHVIVGELSPADLETESEQVVRAMATLDEQTWGFNWQNQHQFYYHRLDWYLPEHDELPCEIGVVPKLPLAEIAANQYMTAPVPMEILVDHRYGNVKYWLNESVFILNDDGGLTLADGYGVEFRTTGGNLDIFTPADLNLHVGRSFNVLAGKDANIQANKSLDLIANKGDVRIKAENNFMALAGNNGCGGVLLESRAVCPAYGFCPNVGEDVIHSGIFLKASGSRIVARAADMLLESNILEGYDGKLVLDANDGRVQIRGDFIERFIESAALDLFLDSGGNVVAGSEWWSNQAIIGTTLAVYGCTHTYGLQSKGNVTVIDGHIGTSQAAANNFAVSSVENPAIVDAMFAQVMKEVDELVDTVGPQELDFATYMALKNTHKTVEYSLRTTAQYGSLGYKVAEGRWQQSGRICNAVDFWCENPIQTTCAGHETMYPYPGPDVWCSEESYITLDPKFFDPMTGTPLQRDPNQGEYEEGKLNETSAVQLDGNYAIPIL